MFPLYITPSNVVTKRTVGVERDGAVDRGERPVGAAHEVVGPREDLIRNSPSRVERQRPTQRVETGRVADEAQNRSVPMPRFIIARIQFYRAPERPERRQQRVITAELSGGGLPDEFHPATQPRIGGPGVETECASRSLPRAREKRIPIAEAPPVVTQRVRQR